MEKYQKTIITNMCLVYKDDLILVQERTKSDWPGITFPGGHVELNENLDDAINREVFEETDLILHSAKLCGVEEYKPINIEDRHLIFLYKSNDFEGKLIQNEGEDKIYWMKRSELFTHKLSDDLDLMLKVIEDDTISELIYYWDNNQYKKKLV